MLQFTDVLTAATPKELFAGEDVPRSRASHQFDFSGTTGEVTIELDAHTGYRTVTTVYLSNTAREPFVVICEAKSFRLTSTVETTVAYCASKV